MSLLRDIARRLAQPWLLIAAGTLVLAALLAGQPRYNLSIPPGSISAYSEPGVYVAQIPAPVWPSWLFALPQDDFNDGMASRLVVREDGRTLGPAHTAVSDIALYRGGRFAHWDGALYFSASDNRDPRENGRAYTAESPLVPLWPAWAIGWALVAIGALWHLASAQRRAALFTISRHVARPALYVGALGAGAVWAWIALVGVHQITPLTEITPQQGLAYRAALAPPSGLQAWLIRRSDDATPSPRPSTLLLENGAIVGFPRATLSTVEQMGEGRFLYHQDHLFFSTPDGADPRTNGRTYSARVKLNVPPWFRTLTIVLLLAAGLAAAWQFRQHARWIAGGLAVLSGAAALWSIATLFNVITVDDFVPRARLTPSTATAFVAEHREIIAPFVIVAPPGQGRAYLIANGEPVLCARSLFVESTRSDGMRCARRGNGYQADFEPPAGVDPRINSEPYAVRVPIRADPYLIGALVLATALFAGIAFYRPRVRLMIAGAGALVAALGLLLTGANITGEFLSLRHPDVASLAHDFGPDDLTMSYEDALVQLERRADDTPATYAERATFTLNAAVVHAAPATELDKWRMHVPLWENWALHLLGLVDAKARRYIFWDARKHLERGIGLCGDLSAVLVAFLRENGIEARVASVSGHVVATAEIEPGVWRMYDPDYGLIIPHSLAEVQANPALVQAAYRRWAEARPELDEYTRTFAANVIPSFFASAGDNSIDQEGRTGFYSGLARSADAYIAREALLYRIKWIVPFAMLLFGLGVALFAGRRLRRAN